LGNNSVYFGEASLSGAIRPVSHAGLRLKEAEKLGFSAASVPAFAGSAESSPGMRITALKHLSELAGRFAGPGMVSRERAAAAVG